MADSLACFVRSSTDKLDNAGLFPKWYEVSVVSLLEMVESEWILEGKKTILYLLICSVMGQ